MRKYLSIILLLVFTACNGEKMVQKLESTFSDGTRATFTKDGKTHYSLVPEYTYDSGHLNETGRKKAAEQLLILLASL